MAMSIAGYIAVIIALLITGVAAPYHPAEAASPYDLPAGQPDEGPPQVDQSSDAEYYAQLAKVALAAEQFSDAIFFLSSAIDLDPENPQYYFLRGIAYASAAMEDQPDGDYEAALADLTAAIAIDPERVAYYATRSVIYYDIGRNDLAARDHAAARDIDEEVARYYADEYFFAGKRAHAEGQFALAIRGYSQAIGLDPSAPIHYRLRGMAYREAADAKDPAGDYAKAIADLNAGLELCTTKEFLCWLERGMLHGERGRTYRDAAISYHRTGDYRKAITDFDVALGNVIFSRTREDEPTKVDHFLYSRASVLALRGITYYQAARAGHPVGSYRKAIIDLTRAIRVDPDYIRYYQWRAGIYEAMGDQERAAADRRRPYDTAIGPEPQDPHFYYQQATEMESAGRYKEALENLDRALELAPDDAGSYAKRGSIYVTLGSGGNPLGDIALGIEDLTWAIELEPDDATNYYTRAFGYAALLTEEGPPELFQSIIADLTMAIRYDPYNGRYWRERGRVYRAIGETELAEADLSRAREYDYLD